MRMREKAVSLLLCLAVAAGTGQFAFASQTGGEEGAPESAGAGSAAAIGVEGEDYAAGEVIVVFEKGTTNSKAGEILSDNDASLETKTRVDGSTVALASLDEGTSVSEAIDTIGEEKKVEYVQPNYRYTIKETASDPYLDPSKPLYYQEQFEMTNAKAAWDIVEAGEYYRSSGYSPTTVCVLDTGVDLGHSDLQKNLVSNSSFAQYTAGEFSNEKDDRDEHGTHVTGIIAATYGNGIGGAGLASGTGNDLVKVMPVGAAVPTESEPVLLTMDIVCGMKYAASKGAKVINMSFGANWRDRVQGTAIKELYYGKGIVFVAAAGNENTDIYSDPSDMKEVISVTAYSVRDGKNEMWTAGQFDGSNFGDAKDISAPGVQIMSTVPGDDHSRFTGTSMASPAVSAVCAMMLDADPDLTPAQVRNILCATANDEGGTISGKKGGYGVVDAKEAVAAAGRAYEQPTSEVEQITMKTSEMTIDIDESVYDDRGVGLETLILPAESSAKTVWTSSDESVATVDENGIVTGLAAGECDITASAGGKQAVCRVTVEEANDPVAVKITKKPPELAVGESYYFGDYVKVTVKDPASEAPEEPVYWESSDPSVAAVSDGYIKTKKVGTTTITARTYNGFSDSFVLSVVTLPGRVSFTKKTAWIRYGTSFTFGAVLYDHTGAKMTGSGNMVWSLSPKTCGTIGKTTGKFTPNKAGLKKGYAYVIVSSTKEGLTGTPAKAQRKVIILKKTYKGKTDYKLTKRTVKKTKATIRWKKIPAADRYLVQRAAGSKGKFKTVKTLNAKVVLKSSGTLSYTDKGLKKNRVYRYRIRAQFKENGARKAFGFSNTVKVKTKR